MLGSIEKGRKLPQFGRRHNVTFFNKMHPLSWLVWCSPIEHFIVFGHLALPAREGSWHCTWCYKEPMCPHTGFHIPQRVWRESCFVIFLKSCHKWSLTGAQKVWARTGGAGWHQKCPMPWGRKAGVRKEGTQWLSPHFLGDKRTWLEWKGSSDRGRTKLGRAQRQVTGASWYPASV